MSTSGRSLGTRTVGAAGSWLTWAETAGLRFWAGKLPATSRALDNAQLRDSDKGNCVVCEAWRGEKPRQARLSSCSVSPSALPSHLRSLIMASVPPSMGSIVPQVAVRAASLVPNSTEHRVPVTGRSQVPGSSPQPCVSEQHGLQTKGGSLGKHAA